jgi:hypothetical protein
MVQVSPLSPLSPLNPNVERRHERVHVQQYERWGPLFFFAYAASGIWQLLHGRSAYRDNHFEVQARALSAEERCFSTDLAIFKA